ncbi:MAG TPA: ferritin-like domain-containing protein [Balneolaceae bacterium]
MKKLNNLEDLFRHQLRDIYSAESQLAEALPKMRDKSSNKELQDCFSQHLEETKNHKNRLDEIAKSMDIDLSGVNCKAMEGLIKEANSFISDDAEANVRDAGIIADAQRIEHYEISAYGTAAQYAKALNHEEAANKLHETLNEESSTDKKLSQLATNNINVHAKSSS